ncbi:hypothetical protein COHA_005745 [Chlorella ohadii]|uniref:Amino acid transporter transmembrane domain-containing protein n=1 Tax=Chlorella ohadii TaxID=2649997 RepID=A0AAD5DMM1_9CHLO|nr:hypothetical protein COHA_005745 [Chlorella ohadii]
MSAAVTAWVLFRGACCGMRPAEHALWPSASQRTHAFSLLASCLDTTCFVNCSTYHQVLDTAKAAADLLQLPVACCPTVASSDAPCSALSVVYTPDGVVDHIRYYKRHPNLILLDTSVIAAAPKRLLVAGIGDALATYFEGRATYESHSSNVLGGACTISGLALAKLCYETLLKDARAACAAAEAGVVTPALERIVEANTLLSGLGFESAGLCVAHSVHNGLTKAPGTHAMLHGEKVAFGTVTQLVLEGRPHEELDTVYKFCLSVGLPVTLGQIGVDASDTALLHACAEKAVLQGESCHNEPFKVTAEAVRDAMLAADALGRRYLAEAAIGAGVLSLPFAFRAAGWAGGLLLTAAVAAVEGFTMYVIARYAEWTGSKTYSDLVRKMLGRKAALSMSLGLLFYTYGAATAYMIILGDCFQPLLEGHFGQVWWTARRFVIPALSAATMLPLCFPRTLDAISGFSSITLYALIVVVGCIVTRSWQAVQSATYDWSLVRPFTSSLSFLDALPILAFGFQCHTNLAAVFYELEDEPDLFGSAANLAGLVGRAGAASPIAGAAAGSDAANGEQQAQQSQQAGQAQQAQQAGHAQQAQQAQQAQREERVVLLRNPPRRFVRPVQRTQKLLGMVQVLCASIGLTGVFYCLVGMFGYLEFPTTAMSNILLNYSDKDRLMALARVLVGIIQIVHYPVNHFPARNAIRDLLVQLTGRSFEGWRFNTAEVLAFYAATLVLSLLVSDLGQVFKLIGGSTGAFFIFMMPGAFLIQYAYNKHLHLREGAWEPLLADGDEEAEAGSSAAGTAAAGAIAAAAAAAAGAAPQHAQRAQRGARRPEEYHVLSSKLFWAGCVLQLAGLGLLALTIYTLLAPPI